MDTVSGTSKKDVEHSVGLVTNKKACDYCTIASTTLCIRSARVQKYGLVLVRRLLSQASSTDRIDMNVTIV